MTQTVLSNSPAETMQIGFQLAQTLAPGDVIALHGDLGAGKTAFASGIAAGLGVTDYVTSPTFTIMNVLEGRLSLYHFDVYRISDPAEMEEIGFEEYLYGDGVCIIEWAELIADLLPKNMTNVNITRVGEFSRKIEIQGGAS